MTTKRITGVLSPVVTPFKTDLSPDADRFVRQCTWLLSQNVGLAVFGTNSEANSLSTEEKTELLDRLVAAGVLMLPPFYYKGVSDDGLFRSFAEVVERVGDSALRIYLYHIPPVSNVPITLTLIERLLKAYPGTIARLYDTWRDADADARQKRLDEIRGTFAKYPMIPALKAAIAHWSGDREWATVRPPLVALTPEQRASLVGDLNARGFDMPGLAR